MTNPHSWLEFAREDLRVAELTLEDGIYNQACFHAQQGVEKALKAFLRSHQRSVPQVHSLLELLAICQRLDANARCLKDACKTLERYYIPTRYPDALPGMAPEGLPTRQDAEEAVVLLREALQWIETRLGKCV
ncbi:MAG: HEPN domain-containing protein [Candidatus Omnitrophica bacterium]|nr:HEPN domain-containing protein [Candidatus Omnitrophota bacterium]